MPYLYFFYRIFKCKLQVVNCERVTMSPRLVGVEYLLPEVYLMVNGNGEHPLAVANTLCIC